MSGGHKKFGELLRTKIEISQTVINDDILAIDSCNGSLHPNRKKDDSSNASISSQFASS